MHKFQIEDFIASYPDVETPDLQTLLTAKRELNELAPPLSEPPPGRCEFYKHQELFKRIFLHYDKCLLIARTGTGKSISMINLSESIHQLVSGVRSAMDYLPYIQKAVFLVKGDILAQEFKEQLVTKGTCAGIYDVDIVRRAKSSSSRRSAITRSIGEWWDVDHFQSFANKLAKMTDQQIIEEYSGTLFFIDEAHYIKYHEGLTPENFAEQKQETGKKKTYANIYLQFHRLFHLIKRFKLVEATATPMINHPSELVGHLNLLNDLDNQMREDQFDWDRITLDQLYPYIKGKISFVRELDTGVELIPRGIIPKINFNIIDHKGDTIEIKFQTTVYFTIMSQFQSENYNRASSGNYEIDPRNASCFVFPDGSWGGDFERNTRKTATTKTEAGKVRGKKAVITTPSNRTVAEAKVASGSPYGKKITGYVTSTLVDSFEATPEFSTYLSNFDNVKKSSCKYADLLTKYSPLWEKVRRTKREPKRGSVFIYSGLKSGSGAFVLGLCLEHYGFERFMDTSSVFNKETRELRVEKKYRYAMITGETPNSREAAILELFNSYENRHGEYIKILIGNETTQAGISLANVLSFELMVADWHAAGIYQSLSRIFRATSHKDLLKELLLIDPNAQIQIDVYFHASLSPVGEYKVIQNLDQLQNFEYDPQTKLFFYGQINYASVDLHLYVIAEDKNHKNKRVERILVQTAVDAQINAFRNHRATDQDYTESCYYDRCITEFSNPKPIGLGDILPLTPETEWKNLKNPYLDTSTFDIYYSDRLIDTIISRLLLFFQRAFIINTEDLLKLDQFQDFPEKYLWLAVNKMMRERQLIYDRFGRPSYLYTNNNKIWISQEYPTNIENDLKEIYFENYISIETIAFEKYATSVDQKQKEIIASLLTNFNESKFNEIDLEKKVELFENAFVRFINGSTNPNDKKFVDYFSNSLRSFYINPVTLAQIIDNYYILKNKFVLTPELEDLLVSEDEKEVGDKVYVHWVYNRRQQRDNYGTSIYLRKIEQPVRLFDGQNWRNLQPYEVKVYKFLIEKYISDKLAPFRNKIYEFIDFGGVRRILDDRPKNAGPTSGSTENRGKICEGYSEAGLLEIMRSSGYPMPAKGFPEGTTVAKLCELYHQWMLQQKNVFDFRTMSS